ncbi:MAG: hypothetical protein ACE5I3_09430 [Phycisphaerae bacterium]
MNYRAGLFPLGSCLLSVGGLVLGGCPLEAPPVDETAPAPGTYYVEQWQGKLYYYQLAAVRGAAGRWIELHEGGAWYVGPGFYRLSDDRVWSRDDNAEGLTLDDIIQLHDPPPAPG